MDRRERAYRIERELADRLRRASPSERPRVAREVYGELYQRVHWHPDLTRSVGDRRRYVDTLIGAYGSMVADSRSMLDIGAGSCAFLRRLADSHPDASFVGMDVTRGPLRSVEERLPDNVRFVQASATSPPFADGSFDLVCCSQLLEHLHPDDVGEFVAEAHRLLVPGGWFVLDTPNRITGPHDVSRGFTREATGLHLKEWTYGELEGVLARRGFDRTLGRGLPGRVVRLLGLEPPGPLVPARLKSALEDLVAWLPGGLRRHAARLATLGGIYLYARKE